MAYNNYFPMTYQQQQQPPQNSIIWVQGIEGAKAYGVPPGGTALLMDSDGDFMYIKSADQTGMPTLRTYRYEEVQVELEKVDYDNYITRDEFEKVLEELRKPLVTTKSKKKESKDE